MSNNHKSKLVLIVEDEISLSDAYRILLERSGYRVATAYDGNEAIEILKKESPDIILLDLRMPNLDGIGFLKKYDVKKHHPDTVVVVFSNYDLQKEIDEAYTLGADKYLLKAWASPVDLVKTINQLTGQQ
jgi:CheY-like chemotaxis protein